MDDIRKRPDSPQIRRKSWPSAPRSILKKRSPLPVAKTQLTQISTDTESGVESTTNNISDNISDNINNNPECDGIEVVTNNPFTLVHNGREGLSKIGSSDIIGCTRHNGHESGIIPKLSEIGPQKPVIQEEGGSSNSAATVVSARTARKRRIAGIFQHYYPEGGWGYVIVICAFLSHFLAHGLQLGFLILMPYASRRYQANQLEIDWLTPFSMAVSNLLSPLIIGICRRKSTRVTAVTGGFVTALGCLFTSFASQFHQLYFSYGLMIGIGVAMTKDPATLMVGQYFKRKRELMEIVLTSATGLGLASVAAFILFSVGSIGWRLGLQAVTGLISILFVLGTFYRSASLYHPQRRAILHLKSQKRKIKNKDKANQAAEDTTPPLFDFTTLKSRTVQILLASTAVAALGLNTPLLYMAQQAHHDGIRGRSFLWLQLYLGLAWTVGCIFFGAVADNSSYDCRISKQYLCQAALLLCGISIMAFTAVEGYKGYIVFVWSYGIFLGGYQYCLKMYIYEKVRARNFARALGFAQSSTAIPTLVSIPLLRFVNNEAETRPGYALSAAFVILGSLLMVLIDVHRKNLRDKRRDAKNCKQQRQLQQLQNMENLKSLSLVSPQMDDPSSSSASHELVNLHATLDAEHRQNSFTDQDDIIPPISLLSHQRSFLYDDFLDDPELSIYSEEGIADMDLPDNILYDDFDYLDNITSCNKVENCLMLSEYEQNLIKETEGGPFSSATNLRRTGRKWSLLRQPTLQTIHSETEEPSNTKFDGSVLFGLGVVKEDAD